MFKFATFKDQLLHYLTGTEDPMFLTEREKVMIDKFITFYNTVKVNVIESVNEKMTSKIGLKFEDLKENTIYSLYTSQFKVSNRVRLISFDTTPLHRNIAYFQYVDRGHTQISKKQFIAHMREEALIPSGIDIFAVYETDMQIGNDIITNTPHTEPPKHLGKASN